MTSPRPASPGQPRAGADHLPPTLPEPPSPRLALAAYGVSVAAAAAIGVAGSLPWIPRIGFVFAGMALAALVLAGSAGRSRRLAWGLGVVLAGFGLLVGTHALLSLPGHLADGEVPAMVAGRALVAVVSAAFVGLAAVIALRRARLRRRAPPGPLAPIGYR